MSNLFEFCHGQHDIYYLRKDLKAKPNLNSTVAVDLPEEAHIDSTGRPPSRISSASSTLTTKCKGDKSEVIDLLDDMQVDCKDKKMKDNLWREKIQSMGTCWPAYPAAKCCTEQGNK